MVFEIIVFIVFVLAVGIMAASIVKIISTWNKNNNAPRLTVPVKVVSKRIDVLHHSQANAGDATGMQGYSTIDSTQYFVTFQFESQDQMEFCVSGSEYAMLSENDTGKLSFQGTRYLSFEPQLN